MYIKYSEFALYAIHIHCEAVSTKSFIFLFFLNHQQANSMIVIYAIVAIGIAFNPLILRKLFDCFGILNKFHFVHNLSYHAKQDMRPSRSLLIHVGQE